MTAICDRRRGLSGKAPIRRYLSLLLLIIPMPLIAWQKDDGLQVVSQPDSVQEGGQPDTLTVQVPDSALTGPLFHNPPVAILNDRPFQIDFFVNFSPDTIESISLVFRNDSSHTYKEIPLHGEYNRYSHVLPVEELRGSVLTYYFLVVLRDYGLWAYPTGGDGVLKPYVINLVPPTEKFFQKRYYD
ncbi:MAG: hypothetical protein JSU77_07095 [Fidelibacterota bacterium]|nr:MAG: hypothetical protein JSU77_07095 [Candidatus Neomarinimicrobiota bacterium]